MGRDPMSRMAAPPEGLGAVASTSRWTAAALWVATQLAPINDYVMLGFDLCQSEGICAFR